jgi:hypothetical protein
VDSRELWAGRLGLPVAAIQPLRWYGTFKALEEFRPVGLLRTSNLFRQLLPPKIPALPAGLGAGRVRSELAAISGADGERLHHLLVGYLPAGTGEPEAIVGQAEVEGELADMVDAAKSPAALRLLFAALELDARLEPQLDPANPDVIGIGAASQLHLRRDLGPAHALASPEPDPEPQIALISESGLVLGYFFTKTPDSRRSRGWAKPNRPPR